jgi:hypothetical protein
MVAEEKGHEWLASSFFVVVNSEVRRCARDTVVGAKKRTADAPRSGVVVAIPLEAGVLAEVEARAGSLIDGCLFGGGQGGCRQGRQQRDHCGGEEGGVHLGWLKGLITGDWTVLDEKSVD